MTSPDPAHDRLRELAEAQEPRAGFTNLFFLSPGEGVTELFLIRHAQIGLSDDMGANEHLTDLGREQADVLATYLSSRYRFDAVYASPTLRAQETAAPLAASQSVEVQLVEDLADVKQLRPLDRPLPELVNEVAGEDGFEAFIGRMRREMTFDAFAPFVESSADFRSRVQGAVNAIIDAHPGRRVAVVTHSPVIACYLSILVGTQRDFILNPKLTSITRVFARGNERTIDFANATPHFEG
jgi:probable phosphoglycerate mutase